MEDTQLEHDRFEIDGTIGRIYEDLGPSVIVPIILDKGAGIVNWDLNDLPHKREWWERHLGKRVRIETKVTLLVD